MTSKSLTALGIVAWLIAVGFALKPTVRAHAPIPRIAGDNYDALQDYDISNFTGAAACFGFAIAGALCFATAGWMTRPTAAKDSSRP